MFNNNTAYAVQMSTIGAIIGILLFVGTACGKDPIEPPPPPPDTIVTPPDTVLVPSTLDLVVLVDLVRNNTIIQQETYHRVFDVTGHVRVDDFLEIELPPVPRDTIWCQKDWQGNETCGPIKP